MCGDCGECAMDAVKRLETPGLLLDFWVLNLSPKKTKQAFDVGPTAKCDVHVEHDENKS